MTRLNRRAARTMCLLALWCLGSFFSPAALADDLVGASDDELLRLAVVTEDGCYSWRFFARRARADLFPEDDPIPKEVRIDHAQQVLNLIGPNVRPATSAGHQLASLMYEMALNRSPDEETALAVFRECQKYDKRYVDMTPGDGGHPNPLMRKPGADNAR